MFLSLVELSPDMIEHNIIIVHTETGACNVLDGKAC